MFKQPGKTPYLRDGDCSAASRIADAGGVGKRTLVESLASAPVQRKVATSGGSDDQSAHDAAARGAATPASPLPLADRIQRVFGRHDIPGVQLVQRRASQGPATSGPPDAGGPGAPIASPFREKMERAFGADFSAVRIHEGPQAAAMGAVAYTRGDDIHFQPGAYDVASRSGQELLGHELTHVVQQRSGRVVAQGKDSPINADPALEAEADEMGARAARGEPTGLPAPAAGPATSAPIQRYVDKELDGRYWRFSDGGKIAVPTNASHELYATQAAILHAEQQLQAVQSFIRLDAVAGQPQGEQIALELEGKPQLMRAKPSYRSRGPKTLNHDKMILGNSPGWEDQVDDIVVNYQPGEGEKPLDLGVPRFRNILRTFSDCNKCARLIMGEVGTEKPVVSKGGHDQIYEQQPGGLFKGKEVEDNHAKPIQTEIGGMTALNESLISYRDSDHLRDLPAQPGEHENELAVQVLAFKELARGLTRETPTESWRVYHDMQQQTPAVYRDFSTWASIDGKAKPQVGEALVTYRVMGGHGKRLNKSPLVFQNIAASFGEDKVRDRKVVDTPLHQQLLEAFGPEMVENMKVGEIDLSLLPERNDVEALRKKLLRTAIEEFKAKAGQDDDFLQQYGITVDTPYDELMAKANQLKDNEPRLQRGVEKDDLWNKHWGGVVMVDDSAGYDYVTLENDASTSETSRDLTNQLSKGDVNEAWRFQLHGAHNEGQSFHEQMMLGGKGDFGTLASTMRYRKKLPGDQLQKVAISDDFILARAMEAYQSNDALRAPGDPLAKARTVYTAIADYFSGVGEKSRVTPLIAGRIAELELQARWPVSRLVELGIHGGFLYNIYLHSSLRIFHEWFRLHHNRSGLARVKEHAALFLEQERGNQNPIPNKDQRLDAVTELLKLAEVGLLGYIG